MRLKIEIIDFKRIRAKMEGLPKKAIDSFNAELLDGANQIRTKILSNMQGTKRAAWFTMKDKERHYPSAPGNSPAIDEGELIRSIIVDVNTEGIEVGAEIMAPYAPLLEKGTKKMKARPFLQPAIDSEADDIENYAIVYIKDEDDNYIINGDIIETKTLYGSIRLEEI